MNRSVYCGKIHGVKLNAHAMAVGREIKFFDLTMFVLPGGRERTREEYSSLLAAAGFEIARVTEPGADNFSAIESICGSTAASGN